MSLRFARVFLAAVLFCAMAAAIPSVGQDAKEEGFVPLFNGKDFTGIAFFVDEKAKEKETDKIWYVEKGTIICKGQSKGYFYVDQSYKNYVLKFDWRFPEGSDEKSNSGCLVHFQLPHKVWPRSVEVQGRYLNHGKLFFPGMDTKTEVLQEKFDQDLLKKVRKKMGEWNATEITCKGDGTISVKVNDSEVASGKTVLTEGRIGWQSEGAEVHFKNIHILQK